MLRTVSGAARRRLGAGRPLSRRLSRGTGESTSGELPPAPRPSLAAGGGGGGLPARPVLAPQAALSPTSTPAAGMPMTGQAMAADLDDDVEAAAAPSLWRTKRQDEGDVTDESGGGGKEGPATSTWRKPRPTGDAAVDKANADLNNIWGDYIDYMAHQRDKGWKT